MNYARKDYELVFIRIITNNVHTIMRLPQEQYIMFNEHAVLFPIRYNHIILHI